MDIVEAQTPLIESSLAEWQKGNRGEATLTLALAEVTGWLADRQIDKVERMLGTSNK